MALAVLAAGWAITLIGLVWVLRQRERDRRQSARERTTLIQRQDVLVDRIMYLTDKPWALPEMSQATAAPSDPYENFEFPDMAALEVE